MTFKNENDRYEYFMREAYKEALKAYIEGEVPIGSVVVKDNLVIGRGYNQREFSDDPTDHAEIKAIKKATSTIGDWRLTGCELYVTIEPCMMCCGAIYQSRIEKLIYGSMDHKMGMVDSGGKLLQIDNLNHKVEVISGILHEKCKQLMKNFFLEIRRKKKYKKASNV
ncbi:MAG: tRNA adenosine(34) deaminase TadA [Acidaminobacteraceae bacterium]